MAWFFQESPNWDDTRTLKEIINTAKFCYLFTDKHDTNLASGDYQYPCIVSNQTKKGLIFTRLEHDGKGITVRSDGVAGHDFINEVTKTFNLHIFINPLDCIDKYLSLLLLH